VSGREILRALRARRDFFAETPGQDETGRGWYIGGNVLDCAPAYRAAEWRTPEYSVGGGFRYGPLSIDATACTCGEWHANFYLYLPTRPRPRGGTRRVWAQLWCDERPRFGYDRWRVAA
jgi:hypothetical protein